MIMHALLFINSLGWNYTKFCGIAELVCNNWIRQRKNNVCGVLLNIFGVLKKMIYFKNFWSLFLQFK